MSNEAIQAQSQIGTNPYAQIGSYSSYPMMDSYAGFNYNSCFDPCSFDSMSMNYNPNMTFGNMSGVTPTSSIPTFTTTNANTVGAGAAGATANIQSQPTNQNAQTVQPVKKKRGFWSKVGHALLNIGKGAVSCLGSLIGVDKNGKFSFATLAKNVGLMALAAAATMIPVVGPFVGPALLWGGVAAGTIGVGKGVYKACVAKTDEEVDMAFQDMGHGAFIGVTSAMGLRNVGKAAGLSGKQLLNPKNYYGIAKEQSIAQQNAIGNFARNNGVSNTKAFWEITKSNIGKSISPGEKFRNNKKNLTETIENKLTEIDTKLSSGTLNTAEKVALEQQKLDLSKLKTEINNAKTKADWDALIGKDKPKQTGNSSNTQNAGAQTNSQVKNKDFGKNWNDPKTAKQIKDQLNKVVKSKHFEMDSKSSFGAKKVGEFLNRPDVQMYDSQISAYTQQPFTLGSTVKTAGKLVGKYAKASYWTLPVGPYSKIYQTIDVFTPRYSNSELIAEQQQAAEEQALAQQGQQGTGWHPDYPTSGTAPSSVQYPAA